MTRILWAAAVLACVVCCAPNGAAQGNQAKTAWGTINGRMVWAGKALPAQPPLRRGATPDEKLLVNAKDRGIKYVIVSLAQNPALKAALPIHPTLRNIKEQTVTLTMPNRQFIPRVVVVRQGQKLALLNNSLVNHNIQWISALNNAPGGNVLVPAGMSHTIEGLVADRLPLVLRCNIHPWMEGRVGIFDHPYFTVTDEHGQFEIKDAPAGKFRLVAYQEAIGWRGGARGRYGEEVTVKAGGVTDLGDLKMGGE